MAAKAFFKCFFWSVFCCLLFIVSGSEEDLVDFDFSDLKEIDWNYDNDNASNEMLNKKLSGSTIAFDDDIEENQVHPFDWREKLLTGALSKVLTNAVLRQKFVEVMPILRVLSPQQRLALSALIAAQINAKKGQELKLEQVRMMFGDDKKLLIPIVYDIANLVRNSARKYLQLDYETQSSLAELQQTPIEKREFELTSAELAEEEGEKDVGVIQATEVESSLEDFLGEMPEDVLDPQSINEELQAVAAMPIKTKTKTDTTTASTTTVRAPSSRSKRAATPTEFVHKLIRSVPQSVNEDDLLKGAAGRTVKLNTTAFLLPQVNLPQLTVDRSAGTVAASPTEEPLSYHEIEDLAFANLNGTEVSLSDGLTEQSDSEEPLPSPEELIAGPRYRVSGNKLRVVRPKVATKRKRVQLQRARPKVPLQTPSASAGPLKKCERFTASMCIRTDDYPLEQIMGSIRRHKNAMTALLAEYHEKPYNLDFADDFEDFVQNKKRREDEASSGGMCQSIVRYARPQKARSASGEWKYIVNTGQHTQTLRLEKCTNPQESCSYLAQNYRSHCSQVYNYHRLLSWDKQRGLHVDIFKVPTCCSCQVDGYRQQFPPLSSIQHKDYSPAHNSDIYSTINEDLDYNDEEDEEDTGFQIGHGFAHHSYDGGYDANELSLSSKKVRTKVHAPSPTVGSYLSPPGSDEYDTKYVYKSQRLPTSSSSLTSPAASNNLLSHLPRRRPYKSLSPSALNEARVDLEIAPSETHTDKEVKFYGTPPANDKTRVQQKRKRIYSVPHTATSRSITTADASTSTVASSPPGTSYTFTRGSIHAAGTAATAHQTPAAIPSHYTPSGANNIIIGSGNAGLTKSRFQTPATTTSPSVPPPTTESTHHYQPSSAHPPIYQVNSLYSAKYNATSGIFASGPKRINYSYHPIIDFFENHKRTASASTVGAGDSSTAASEIYPHKIPKSKAKAKPAATSFGVYQPHERRIGYGAGGNGEDNAWHPLVVES